MRRSLSLLFSFIFSLNLISQGSSNALDLSGGIKDLQVPYNAALNPSTNISVEAWIYPMTYGPQSWRNTIVSTDSWTQPGGEQGYVLRCGAGGILSFNFAINPTGWREALSTSTMALNKWHHVVGTYDGSTIKVYINGQLDGSFTYSGTIKTTTSNSLKIGSLSDPSQSREFDGHIDEVRIWNITLSESQIRDRMCKRLKGNEAGLIAYYPMDEGTGTSTADKSTNSFNATMGNPQPSWVVSNAHVGDTSVMIYPSSWVGQQLSISHNDGDNMTVSSIGGAPAGIQLYMTDSPHGDTAAPSTHFSLMNQRHWGVFSSGAISSYKVDYDFNGYPNIIAPSALSLAHKTGNSGWTASTTNPPTGTVISSIPTESQHIILSSLSPQVAFYLLSPVDSAAVVLQGNGIQTVTFSWENPGLDASARYDWMIDKITGTFSPPQMALASDNGGKDTTMTFTYYRLDSVLNYISLPQGHTRWYKWSATTKQGLIAIEPFYCEFTRGTLGFKKYKILQGIEVYPTIIENGEANYFYSGLEGLVGNIEIRDISGKLIDQLPFTANKGETQTLNLQGLVSGTYFLKFESSGKIHVETIEIFTK
ncbi:MAG: LamG-like jellyroll fold domain-containing protein [Bacteroidia bacterium]